MMMSEFNQVKPRLVGSPAATPNSDSSSNAPNAASPNAPKLPSNTPSTLAPTFNGSPYNPYAYATGIPSIGSVPMASFGGFGNFGYNSMGGVNPAMLGGMNPAMLGGMNPAMLGGMNPAMLGGMNPAMLGGMNPAMLGGINPAMLGGMNPAMLGMNGIQPGNGATNGAQFGYGPTTSLAPTIFTTPLSGDGTLQAHDSRRASQELYAEQNSTAASYDVAIKAGETAQLVTSGAGIGLSALVGGGLGKLAKSSKLGWAVFLAGSIASGIGGNLVRRATAGTVQKATRDGLHKQAIQSYTGLDTADNGWRDGSYTAQRNYRTQDTPEGLKQDMLTAGLGYFGLAPQSKGLRLTPGT